MRDAPPPLGGPAGQLRAADVTELATARSGSPQQTARLAAALAPWLRGGDCLCLGGDLGAGKTTFVSGLVGRLGARGPVVSPTFTLENRYPVPPQAARPAAGALPPPRLVSHFDLYRTDGRLDPELLAMMLEARDEGALVCVEWPGPAEAALAPCLHVEIVWAPGRGGRARRLTLSAWGAGWTPAPELLRAWAPGAQGRP